MWFNFNHFLELFTDNILAANAFVFFIAGFETTASTISYVLYELAMNPEIQVKLREIIKHKFDENEGTLTYDTLKELKYLDMVINGLCNIIKHAYLYDFISNILYLTFKYWLM